MREEIFPEGDYGRMGRGKGEGEKSNRSKINILSHQSAFAA
jgi:hypothetical protein